MTWPTERGALGIVTSGRESKDPHDRRRSRVFFGLPALVLPDPVYPVRVLRSEHRELRRRRRSRIRVSLPAARAVVSGGVAAVPVPRYYVKFRERYRIFNDAEYRFYRSNSAPPVEGDSPFDTASSLPHTPTATFTNGTWWISMSYFNGILDSGFYPIGPRGETYLRLDISGGDEVLSPPEGPRSWRLEARAGGVTGVVALYTETGALRADEWALTYTSGGATPGTPPAVSPTATQSMVAGRVVALDYELPARGDGTTIKVRLQTRRNDGGSWTYSEDSTVETILADGAGPAVPQGGEPWPGGLREEAQQ